MENRNLGQVEESKGSRLVSIYEHEFSTKVQILKTLKGINKWKIAPNIKGAEKNLDKN